MISELKKLIRINDAEFIPVEKYLIYKINKMPINSEFILRDLLSDYSDSDIHQLGKEFVSLVQSKELTGLMIVSKSLIKYKKFDNIRYERLFCYVNQF